MSFLNRVKSSKLGALILLILLLLPVEGLADLKPINDISCPPPPKLPDSCDYNSFKCPEGYALKPSFSIANAMATGMYACIPIDNINGHDEFRTCYYYNPACLKNVNSSQATRNYFDRIIKENFNTGNKENYIDRLIDLATFDPKAIENLESYKTRENVSFYLFLADAFKKASDVMFSSSITFVLFGLGWLLLLFTGQTFLKERFIQHPAVFTARLLAFGLVFWIPMPHKTDTTTYWIPISFDVTRALVKEGSHLADQMSMALNTSFVERVILKMADDTEDTVLILQKKGEDLKKKVKEIEPQYQTCLDLYSYTDFLDTPLEKIPDPDPNVLNDVVKKYGEQYRYYFSKVKCREIELAYKRAVAQYNSLVVQYKLTQGIETDFQKLKGVNVSTVASDPEKYLTANDKYVRAVAWILHYQKKMGWLSFPLFTLPMGHYLLAFSPKDLVGTDVHNPSWPVKAVGILSLPPGNMIFGFLKGFADELGTLAGAIVGAAGGSVIPFLGTTIGAIIGGFVAKAVVAGTGKVVAGIIAYFITIGILTVLPFLILAAVIIIRFTFWIIGIAKLVLASPFVVLHSFSTRNYYNAYRVVMNIGVIAMLPIMLIAGALLGYFGITVSGFLIYDLGCKVLDMAGAFGGHGLLWKIFIKFPTKGILYYLSVLIQIYLAYKIPMRAPEWFLEVAGFRELTGTEGGIASEITETLKSRGLPV